MVTVEELLKAVEAFPVEGPIDEAYVREYVRWSTDKTVKYEPVERVARQLAIEKAGLKAYYKELMKPIIEANRARRLKEHEEWWASEDYQWLRNYLLTNTNGSVEEIEELISPADGRRLHDEKIPRTNYANWLWNTRHYFNGPDRDLETVLEMGATARKVEKEFREDK